MIIWINGGFGAGKTTLAGELRRRLPDALVYDPEDVGLMLWKWMPRGGDFQHLPAWRELVVATALSLRRHCPADPPSSWALILSPQSRNLRGDIACFRGPVLAVADPASVPPGGFCLGRLR